MEDQIRLEAFRWLREQQLRYGDVLPRDMLIKGFPFRDGMIGLMSPAQGIFKPKALSLIPISITTTVKSPYEDALMVDGFIRYKYRGTDPQHIDNRGLRQAMRDKTPLIYFHATAPGRYVPIWPVYIVGDDPASLTFQVAADESSTAFLEALAAHQARNADNGSPVSYGNAGKSESGIAVSGTNPTNSMQQGFRLSEVGSGTTSPAPFDFDGYSHQMSGEELRRSYATVQAKQRLFQHTFRDIVLHAYQEQCAFCRLRHTELLDAAHIIPDREDEGKPIVNNGMSLCKIHHAAFDANIIGIRPDHVIQVNDRVLQEVDGPMLKYGIQQMHNERIILPKSRKEWPDEEKLKVRYEQFQAG